MLNTDFGGRYVVKGEIAKSRKAWIYRAVDAATGADAAIKVLRPFGMPGQQLEARFAREIQVLKSLEHPNIVRLFETGLTSNGLLYFAMELVNGQTLWQLVEQEGPLKPARVTSYLEQIASAIDMAHAHSIVHRDVNPNNLLIQVGPNGQETVKVLDFGLAKVLETAAGGSETPGTELTSDGMVVGTPSYMSPEQAKGIPVGSASDVYSLGATLYAVLNGTPPFERATEFETIVAHVTDPVPEFRDSAWRLPGLEEAVRRAMSKNPSDRPASAGELARLFRKTLQDYSNASKSTIIPRVALPLPVNGAISPQPQVAMIDPAAARRPAVATTAAAMAIAMAQPPPMSQPKPPNGKASAARAPRQSSSQHMAVVPNLEPQSQSSALKPAPSSNLVASNWLVPMILVAWVVILCVGFAMFWR